MDAQTFSLSLTQTRSFYLNKSLIQLGHLLV